MDEDKPAIQPTYDPTLIEKLIDNQTIELGLRQQQEDNRKVEIENTHAYSMKLLDAQLVDRQNERELARSNTNIGGCLTLLVSLAIIGSLCYALHLNKDQFVREFLQTLAQIGLGGLGGYSIRALKEKGDKKGD